MRSDVRRAEGAASGIRPASLLDTSEQPVSAPPHPSDRAEESVCPGTPAAVNMLLSDQNRPISGESTSATEVRADSRKATARRFIAAIKVSTPDASLGLSISH